VVYQVFPEITRFSFMKKEDRRGGFQRVFDAGVIPEGGDSTIEQISFSNNPNVATLRGLHYLEASEKETKTIFILNGIVQDVLVDVRMSSTTFLNHYSTTLQAGSGLIVPPGFAHGYLTLSSAVDVLYIMSCRYKQDRDRGLRYDDPAIGIVWEFTPSHLSARDLSHPLIGSAECEF